MTADSSAAAVATDPVSWQALSRKYRSRSCPTVASASLVPLTETECSPSENPDGNFVTHPSAPWVAGGKVHAVFISVPVTPKTFCRPVGSPAAGLGATIVPESVYAGSGVTEPLATVAP